MIVLPWWAHEKSPGLAAGALSVFRIRHCVGLVTATVLIGVGLVTAAEVTRLEEGAVGLEFLG